MNLGPFEHLVPATAAAICAVLVVHSYSRQMPAFAAAVTAWFAFAYILSYNNVLFQSEKEWSDGDWVGMGMLASLPIVPQILFDVALQRSAKVRQYVYDTPVWGMTAFQTYRLGGASYYYQYLQGEVPKLFGLQTGLLDIFIGMTAIPLALRIRSKGLDEATTKTLVLAWNAVGLYHLAGAFGMVMLDFMGILPTDPHLSIIGFHPLVLTTLIPVSFGMGFHTLMLTSLDKYLVQKKKD